jgi:tetratricopeptide (TPR) repeat protein
MSGPGVAAPSADRGGSGEPFVGRATELTRLTSLLERALDASGSIALITGEAAIGKTALAGEFLRRARQREPSMVLCRGRCVEQYGTGEAYLPFLDALGSLLVGRGREPTAALLRTYAPTWCVQLPALGAPHDALNAMQHQTIGATKERMLREMGDVFEAAAGSALLIGFLEDMQWADPSTADVVRHLLNRIERQRILLIGTLRPSALQAHEHPLKDFFANLRTHKVCHEISLGPLGPEEVAALLEARFEHHRFPAELAELIHRRTEGHPLFVTSLIQLLLDRGDIVREADERAALARLVSETALDAPENVRALVRRKMESLAEADRLALQYASVMGREFPSTALAAVLGADETVLQERLLRLDRAHRLIDTVGEEELPGGSLATRYRFTHSLFQEILYDDLVSKRRVLMHRQVGEQLAALYGNEAPRTAATLALHFERGRDFSAAVTYLAHAADNAARLGANGEAEEHLKRALALVEKLPAEHQVERAFALYQKQGAIRLAASCFDDAAQSHTKMLELARVGGKPSMECFALSGLCNALFFSHRIEEMAVRAAQALHAADRADSGALRVEAMLLVAQILQHDGSLDDCKKLLDEIIPLARDLGHRRALLAGMAYRGVVHYWQSEYARAEERLAEALPLASELRDGLMVLICLQFLGLARGNRGRMSQALVALHEGLEMGRRNGDRFWLPRLASHVGWIHRELQDFDRAIEHDQEGLALARKNRVVEAETNALLNLSLDYTQAGRLDEALEILERLEKVRGRVEWFGWLYEIRFDGALTEHWLARGDMARAAAHARQLLADAGPRGAHTYVVTAHRALLEVSLHAGDLPSAASHAAAALDEIRSHPAPVCAWRLHAAIGRLRAAAGNRGGARDAYREAAVGVRAIADGVEDSDLKGIFLGSTAVRAVLEGEARA